MGCISFPFSPNYLVMKNTTKEIITQQKPSTIRSMFDAIAPTYDVLNHLMSFGMDIVWRKRAIKYFREKQNGIILDIASGSGDVALSILRQQPASIIAADFSMNMLNVFREKIKGHPAQDSVSFVCCDALALPIRNESVDGTIVAFGIRNFADRLLGLQEMYRVLKPKGISVILELTTPTSLLPLAFYRFYTRYILPALGKIISRSNSAYLYLPQSISTFPRAKEFSDLMRQAGFNDIRCVPLSFGSATIFIGRKN
jgi:demethylmenaquinone methyltransferase / 2-methoxy-6-polyprenyl-1,4-benzoquinol methylase